jgi:hypothetical protein
MKVDYSPHPLLLTLGAFTLGQINDIVGILAGLAAFCYTIWRWRRDANKHHKAP